MIGRTIGFIGFGEVASALSRVLREHGAEVIATDVLLEKPGGEATLRGRMATDGIRLVNMTGLMEQSDVVLSTVTTQVAQKVADEAARFLREDQIYVDLNSTAPAVKVAIGEIVGRSGARFVEGAILGAIGATGGRTRILLAGPEAEDMAGFLSECGLNVAFYSPIIGKASMFKMLRSIFSKGLECLVIELLVSGRRAGIEEDLWRDITEFMVQKPFSVIADNWIRTHAGAYERRYYEMIQVLETMRELNVEPIMTTATTAFFERSVSLPLSDRLPPRAGEDRHAVVEALDSIGR